MNQSVLETLKFIIQILVLAVGIGYWAGEIKARRRREPIPVVTNGNGTPTLGEVIRRLAVLEDQRDQYMRMDLAERMIEEGRRDRQEMHDSLTRLQNECRDMDRRIERLMGQS